MIGVGIVLLRVGDTTDTMLISAIKPPRAHTVSGRLLVTIVAELSAFDEGEIETGRAAGARRRSAFPRRCQGRSDARRDAGFCRICGHRRPLLADVDPTDESLPWPECASDASAIKPVTFRSPDARSAADACARARAKTLPGRSNLHPGLRQCCGFWRAGGRDLASRACARGSRSSILSDMAGGGQAEFSSRVLGTIAWAKQCQILPVPPVDWHPLRHAHSIGLLNPSNSAKLQTR